MTEKIDVMTYRAQLGTKCAQLEIHRLRLQTARRSIEALGHERVIEKPALAVMQIDQFLADIEKQKGIIRAELAGLSQVKGDNE